MGEVEREKIEGAIFFAVIKKLFETNLPRLKQIDLVSKRINLRFNLTCNRYNNHNNTFKQNDHFSYKNCY